MGIFSRIFTSETLINKGMDAVIATGDKLAFTDEEKADNRERVREWYIHLLDSLKPYNVTMRVIAITLLFTWLLFLLLTSVFAGAAILICAPDAEVCRTATVSALLSDKLSHIVNPNFATVLQFYFGAAGINSIVSTIKSKK